MRRLRNPEGLLSTRQPAIGRSSAELTGVGERNVVPPGGRDPFVLDRLVRAVHTGVVLDTEQVRWRPTSVILAAA